MAEELLKLHWIHQLESDKKDLIKVSFPVLFAGVLTVVVSAVDEFPRERRQRELFFRLRAEDIAHPAEVQEAAGEV